MNISINEWVEKEIIRMTPKKERSQSSNLRRYDRRTNCLIDFERHFMPAVVEYISTDENEDKFIDGYINGNHPRLWAKENLSDFFVNGKSYYANVGYAPGEEYKS